MPTLVIENIPDKLHRRLKEQAQKARRSLEQEVIYLLEAELRRNARPVHGLPVPYEGKKPLTDELIQRLKRTGMG